jgi:hypothetical protein
MNCVETAINLPWAACRAVARWAWKALGWNRQPDSTFRIWCASTEGSMAENESPERFAQVLGEAALDLWSELPQEWQQQLFERAVRLGHKTERDESLREQLAAFLHNHHERTVAR